MAVSSKLRALLQIAALLYSSLAVSVLAHAHSLGHSATDGPTPPLKAYLAEVQALSRDLPNGLGIRGVLDQFKLWPENTPLVICFNNGEQPLRKLFVATSQLWLPGTSLQLDFGAAPDYRACSGARADIRVSFNPADGHWSYVGTDSKKYLDTSLNIGYDAIPSDALERKELEATILHEMGHAIGFEHEHQSPASKCEHEFDWPTVYDYAATQWGWTDRQVVDFNMRVLASSERLRITPYDRHSIMHYYFEPALFKRGKDSPCYVGHNYTLSQVDRDLAREAYPPQAAAQGEQLQNRANVASAALAPMNLSGRQLARVGHEIGQVLAAAPRKIILDFDLARAAGKPVTRGPGDFKPCGQQPEQAADAKLTLACEVATDGSALLVAVEPK